MKIRQVILACIVVLSLMMTWSKAGKAEPPLETGQIESYTKLIFSVDNYVIVQGRWKTTAGNLKTLSRINATHIVCDKHSMTCKEIIAVVKTPQEEPLFKKPQLFLGETIYIIVDWSNDIISAKYEGPVADVELRISLRDKFAERRFRETKARGIKSADPNNYEQWILE